MERDMYATTTKQGALVKAGVGVIVRDGSGRILLERRRDNGRFGLPGGAVEPGESLAAAALREVLEETGLVVRIAGLLGVYSDPAEGRIVTYPDNGDVRHLVDVVFTADIVSGVPRPSAESLELAFRARDDLPADIVPPARRAIADYFAGRSGVIA
jgi:8-oxo-dGTP pyrophosphatase MutT (NUDIX family)